MKKLLLIFIFILAAISVIKAESPYVVVLGIGQDAGVPQIGCETPFCKKAWKNPKIRRMVSSIALVNPDTNERWVFDATPDFPAQFEVLKEVTSDYSNNLAGIFLTHAHIGHYTGLMYLGRESMNSKDVKVFAMPGMKTMLETNALWSQLVNIKNIAISPLIENEPIKLNENLKVEPFLVPHRDEFSETVGYKIISNSKSLIFIPDIDKWQKWNQKLEEVVKLNDYVFIDGTFYQDGEINRPMSEVPHPFVSETMELLKNLPAKDKAKVFFIHFNHTNPLVQNDKKKLREVKSKGFNVAFEKQKIDLQ
ncbi:MAG: MBL fold metallo-hydrolase [Acidobacteriota bacterium]